MEIEKPIKSHVQINKRWMDNFAFDSNGKPAVYVFSPIFGIKVKSTFSIGIEKGYYTNATEKNLSYLEGDFSALAKSLIDNQDDDLKLEKIIKENQQLLIDFYSILAIRNRQIFEFVKLNLIHDKRFFDYYKKQNFLNNEKSEEEQYLEYIDKITPSELVNHTLTGYKLFGEKYKFEILKNKSDLNFINNSYGTGIVERKNDKERIIYSPISTKLCIRISIKKTKYDNNFAPINLTSIKKIKTINESLIYSLTSLPNDKQFLIAHEEKDIKEAVNVYQKMRLHLDIPVIR